jgi:hypothetical protein
MIDYGENLSSFLDIIIVWFLSRNPDYFIVDYVEVCAFYKIVTSLPSDRYDNIYRIYWISQLYLPIWSIIPL